MGRKVFTSAVVGLGNIGLGYDLEHRKDYVQTHTKAYLRHKGFRLSFGVDPDSKKRIAFERFSRRPSYDSIEHASKDFPSVDVLSLCVAPEHRDPLWDGIARMRPKTVILEKPLARDLAAGKRIVAWAAKNRINLCVNYFRRFEPTTYFLDLFFKNREWGNLLGVDIWYNGGFFNNASHYIDLMLLLFGKPLKARHEQIRKSSLDFEVDFELQYPSFKVHGRSVQVDCPVGEITFWCQRAQICYRKFGQQIDILRPKPDPIFRKFKELALVRSIKTRAPYAMAYMAESVYRSLCRDQSLVSTGKDALETLKICENVRLKK